MRRLFPVVHPETPEREAEYQRLMRDELVAQPVGRHRGRRAGARRAAGRKVAIDEAELLAFVQAVNSLRLVLGTAARRQRGRRPRPRRRAVGLAEYQLYGYLSWVLDWRGPGPLAGARDARSPGGRREGRLLVSRCSSTG